MKASSFWSLLINPFTRIAGWRAFFIGLIILLATIVVGYWGSTLPVSLLSIRPMHGVELSTVFFCQLSILVTVIVLVYITALIATKHVRFQDVVGIMTLAQAPTLLLIATGPLLMPFTDSVLESIKGDDTKLNQLQSMGSFLFVTIIGIVLIIILIWYITVLYNGFRTLTDLKGAKAIVAFILVVVVLGNLLSLPLISLLTNGEVDPFSFS